MHKRLHIRIEIFCHHTKVTHNTPHTGLRGEVFRSPAQAECHLALFDFLFRQPEIDQRDMALRVNQDILRLDIPAKRATRVS